MTLQSKVLQAAEVVLQALLGRYHTLQWYQIYVVLLNLALENQLLGQTLDLLVMRRQTVVKSWIGLTRIQEQWMITIIQSIRSIRRCYGSDGTIAALGLLRQIHIKICATNYLIPAFSATTHETLRQICIHQICAWCHNTRKVENESLVFINFTIQKSFFS